MRAVLRDAELLLLGRSCAGTFPPDPDTFMPEAGGGLAGEGEGDANIVWRVLRPDDPEDWNAASNCGVNMLDDDCRCSRRRFSN